MAKPNSAIHGVALLFVGLPVSIIGFRFEITWLGLLGAALLLAAIVMFVRASPGKARNSGPAAGGADMHSPHLPLDGGGGDSGGGSV